MNRFTWQRAVIKVGSALIAPEGNECSGRFLLALARFITASREAGKEVILVSSGSVAAGRSKVKVRHKIVADGLNDDSFDVTNKGVHVGAAKFNELIEDKNTVLVDMRNHYESEIGHFKNAVTPDVDTFRESLDIIEDDLKEHKEDKNLVMYCTGGIRCEKASAYFKHKGFKNVYQLEGGIIEYTRQIKEHQLENKFLGQNFVFDDRRAERISEDVIAYIIK